MPDSNSSGEKRVIAHYEVEQTLGRGSVGTVYLARDRRIGRRVALKWIDVEAYRFEDEAEETEFFDRLQREVEVTGRLNHVNLVTLYDVGYENGRVSHLAMELVDGPSLLQIIKSRKPDPLPPDEAIRIATQVLRGLAYAHAQGIIHRDIKPANVLLTAAGTAKIADFGVARPADSSMTAAGTIVGTPNYMSPEQVRGHETTARSDLFSLGAVLYEMLTGRKPFAATDVSGVLYKVVSQSHPPIESPDVPLQLKRLVDRLLEKEPEDRPRSAEEALAEMEEIEAGLDTQNEITSVGVRESDDGTFPPDQVEGIDAAIEQERPSILARTVGPAVFWSVIGLALSMLIAVATSIASRIDDSPTVTISEEKLQEFVAKRQALEDAEGLCEKGKFDECVAAYDAYLETYPGARAAIAAREEAVKLQHQVKTGADPERSSSAWQRFKGRVRKAFGKD